MLVEYDLSLYQTWVCDEHCRGKNILYSVSEAHKSYRLYIIWQMGGKLKDKNCVVQFGHSVGAVLRGASL